MRDAPIVCVQPGDILKNVHPARAVKMNADRFRVERPSLSPVPVLPSSVITCEAEPDPVGLLPALAAVADHVDAYRFQKQGRQGGDVAFVEGRQEPVNHFDGVRQSRMSAAHALSVPAKSCGSWLCIA